MALTLAGVVDAHLARCRRPIDIRLVLGLTGKVRYCHDVVALTGNDSVVTVLVLCFQRCTSHELLLFQIYTLRI